MTEAAISRTRSSNATSLVADSFSKSAVLLGCMILVQRGIGFVRSFYVCGSLSPSEVGQWDLAFNFLMIAAPLTVLGIPGSFGRYLSRYEKSGRLSKFLRQTLIVCLVLTIAMSILVYVGRAQIGEHFFGGAADHGLIALLALGLPAVVFFNFATSWFTGKRLTRIVFRMQFVQTAMFALGCLIAFQLHAATSTAVVGAYLFSCFVATCLAAGYGVVDRCNREQSEMSPKPFDEHSAIWTKILPFAAWVWISNCLLNLFSVCDRLLLVNFHSETESGVQFLVGQYHTACILPYLLMTIGAMAASMGTPYLSKDWEAGDRDAVTERLNLMLKVIGMLCAIASLAIMFVTPLLFSGLWKDKFAIGESLLPMTLSYCSLAAMTYVAQKYFWCIEKTRISSFLLLSGLVVNFVVGLTLIRRFGIEGVVASTLVSHAMVLTGVLVLCRLHGMKVHRGVYFMAVVLFAICLGKVVAGISVGLLAIVTVTTPMFFDDSTKRRFASKIRAFASPLLERI